MSTLETPRREGSTVLLRNDGQRTRSVENVSVSKPELEDVAKSDTATTQDKSNDPKQKGTEASSGRASAVKKSPDYSLASHFIQEVLMLGETPYQLRENQMRHRKKKEQTFRTRRNGTAHLPPLGHGATGDGTNDVR